MQIWFGPAVRRIVEGETKFSKIGNLAGASDANGSMDLKALDLQQLFLAMTEEVSSHSLARPLWCLEEADRFTEASGCPSPAHPTAWRCKLHVNDGIFSRDPFWRQAFSRGCESIRRGPTCMLAPGEPLLEPPG